jgi:hypothetical protein
MEVSGQLSALVTLQLVKGPPVQIGYECGWVTRGDLDMEVKRKLFASARN